MTDQFSTKWNDDNGRFDTKKWSFKMSNLDAIRYKYINTPSRNGKENVLMFGGWNMPTSPTPLLVGEPKENRNTDIRDMLVEIDVENNKLLVDALRKVDQVALDELCNNSADYWQKPKSKAFVTESYTSVLRENATYNNNFIKVQILPSELTIVDIRGGEMGDNISFKDFIEGKAYRGLSVGLEVEFRGLWASSGGCGVSARCNKLFLTDGTIGDENDSTAILPDSLRGSVKRRRCESGGEAPETVTEIADDVPRVDKSATPAADQSPPEKKSKTTSGWSLDSGGDYTEKSFPEVMKGIMVSN